MEREKAFCSRVYRIYIKFIIASWLITLFIITGRLPGDRLKHPIEIRNTVKIQKFADLLVADISALKQLTSLFDLQPVDILYRRKTGQLPETSAVHGLA